MPIPVEIRERIGAVVETAAEAGSSAQGGAVRWVGPDAYHLTLRFLGATPTERVGAAAEAVMVASAAARPFIVSLRGAGAFPGTASPRTLWLGVDAGGDDLAALAAALDAALASRGWAPEGRPFRAHLTLARCEDPRAGRVAAAAVASAAEGLRASWRAATLVLYESHLGRGPARYEVVAEGRLGS